MLHINANSTLKVFILNFMFLLNKPNQKNSYAYIYIRGYQLNILYLYVML